MGTDRGATVATGDASPARQLLPASPSFAGHQTFAVRSGWLKKGLDALQNQALGGGSFFTREDALVHLGVGKNMVQSIRYWLLTTRMAEEVTGTRGRELSPTPLGRSLLGTPEGGWDPFLEDDATLWLLHWCLAGPGSPSFTWVWTFNMFREYEFSRESLVESVLSGTVGRVPKVPARETVGRDVECLLHTYVGSDGVLGENALECPLRYLDLIQPAFSKHYRLSVGPKPSLPARVFYYAMVEYWQWRHRTSQTVSVRELTFAEGSPGMVFKLDEDSVLEYLDGIADETDGAIRFEDTSLLREVIWDSRVNIEPSCFLEEHYHA